VPCARLGGAIFAVVLALGGGVALAYLALGTEASRATLAWIGALAVLVLALAALSGWFYPPLEFRHAAWRLSPFGLEIRRGVWFRHALSVPRAREHADVERGPLERRFGLATLVVHTAGHQHSEIRLEGLEHATALAIRDSLLAHEESPGG
jgi:membrane protein YdbS with pleckstrin-like domain